VRENPQSWKHFLRYVPDEQLPDEFDTIAHVRQTLAALDVSSGDVDEAVVQSSLRSFERLHSTVNFGALRG
jgi:hypothetical protein